MIRGHMDLLAGKAFTVASYGIGAAYAGWVLGQLGAEVSHATALEAEGIGAFLGDGAVYANEPVLDVPAGGTLITDVPDSSAARERIGELRERGLVVWLTPWGAETGWSERPASELSLFAASGWMSMVGEAEREPLAPPVSLGQFITGLYATLAALTREAGWGGTHGLAEIAEIEALTSTQ